MNFADTDDYNILAGLKGHRSWTLSFQIHILILNSLQLMSVQKHFRRYLRRNFSFRRLVVCVGLIVLVTKVITKRFSSNCYYPIVTNTVVSSTSLSTSNNETKLSLVVLTHSRTESLLRLLRSLRDASYDGDKVDLHVWIDRSKDGTVNEDTVNASSEFEWLHGSKNIHVWDKHVGIWGQWIDSWREKGAALILEDDLQVSPQYYRWLARASSLYYDRSDVFGYTLQRGTLRANRTGFGRKPLRIPKSSQTFMYPLLGSWGYSPVPKHWGNFREWFHTHACDPSFHPYVNDLVPTLWYKKQERKKSMWTMWHIRYAHDNHLYTVYANLENERTLAASWREPGLHFRAKKGAEDKQTSARLTGKMDFELLESDSPLPELPNDPPIYNWNGVREL